MTGTRLLHRRRLALTDVSKVVSQLRVPIKPDHRRLRNVEGPAGRLRKLSQIVTGLLKYERIELNYAKADEARGYAERLISEAIRHGDCHTPTMEMADYWIQEKQVIHKLFKVLAPRYQNTTLSYTKLYRAPKLYAKEDVYPKSVLELRGNPFPSLLPDLSQNRNLIHNVLLDEAKKEYRARKYAEMTEKLSSVELQAEKAEGKEEKRTEPVSEKASTKASSAELQAEKAEDEGESVAQSASGTSSATQGSEESLTQKSAESEEGPEKATKSSLLKERPEEPKSS